MPWVDGPPVEPQAVEQQSGDGLPVEQQSGEGLPVEPQPVEPQPEPTAEPAAELDALLAGAVDLARSVAQDVAGGPVGQHLGAQADPAGPGGGAVVTHSFASTHRAYVGWRWAVTLARAEGSEVATVDEVVLLPGSGALLAPAWVPWSERVQPGDLAAGDLLPPPADDERLVPAYTGPETDPQARGLVEQVSDELFLGRARVLSREGRAEAAERWYTGEPGPHSPGARQAPAPCSECGFLVPLACALRQAFGVCANAYAPDDGRVVALSHGCGAHSETVVDAAHAATAGMAVQDDEFELLPVGAERPGAPPDEPAPDEPAP